MSNPQLNFSATTKLGQIRSGVRVIKPHIEGSAMKLRQVHVWALWDTGAVTSGISRRAAEALGLEVTQLTILSTAAGDVSAVKDVVLLDLCFDNTIIPVMAAIVDKIPGTDNDFLIGMDVISYGDFSLRTDHTRSEYIVSFKPYPGAFKTIEAALNLPNPITLK